MATPRIFYAYREIGKGRIAWFSERLSYLNYEYIGAYDFSDSLVRVALEIEEDDGTGSPATD
jgi:hypothetical protein